MTARDDFSFFHPLRVRWGECDAQGIVFNVNYFLYFDVAMTEYMRGLGFEGDAMLEFFTVRASADYRASASFDEVIDIGVRCGRIGEKSMTIVFAVFRGDALLTEGALVYAHADRGTKNTSPLPPLFIDRALAFEKIPPERKRAAR